MNVDGSASPLIRAEPSALRGLQRGLLSRNDAFGHVLDLAALGKSKLYLVAYNYGLGAVGPMSGPNLLGRSSNGFQISRSSKHRLNGWSNGELSDIEVSMSFDLERPTGWLAAGGRWR